MLCAAHLPCEPSSWARALSTFGQQFVDPVDGQVYAQSLYVPNVAISGKGTHTVVLVATKTGSAYAQRLYSPWFRRGGGTSGG